MSSSKPIYSIAKELNVNSNSVLLACKTLGILAKASSKRLNKEELEKVINYFKSGKNVPFETIEVTDINSLNNTNSKTKNIEKVHSSVNYFPNRLIG